MPMNKAELRRGLLEKRCVNTENDLEIFRLLISLEEFKKSDLILTYISTDKEIDTRGLIEYCFANRKGVAVPKVNANDITFYEIHSIDDTKKGVFGIPEPDENCVQADFSKQTFCIVPALACNKSGFRIGYGKGYYDRFLCNYEGKSAVLCYSENIIEIPVEAHDRAADIVITEGGLYCE